MRSFEEEMAVWEQARARHQSAAAQADASMAEFAAQRLPDDEVVMTSRIVSYPTAPPPRPQFHSWPPPPDADLGQRLERAIGHVHEQMSGAYIRGFEPLFGVVREMAAEIEKLQRNAQ